MDQVKQYQNKIVDQISEQWVEYTFNGLKVCSPIFTSVYVEGGEIHITMNENVINDLEKGAAIPLPFPKNE